MNGMMGGCGFGFLGTVLFWVLLAGGAVLLFRWLSSESARSLPLLARPDGALEALRERFARGEIGLEEYETIKRGLRR